MSTDLEIRTLPTPEEVAKAKLPESYERAKVAVSECWRIDECKSWDDKFMALLAYARQAEDESLYRMAQRIHGRAIKRMGQLVNEFDAQGMRSDKLLQGTQEKLSKEKVAESAGLSKHQKDQALAVANIPDEQFETLIESENPPTVTALAELGRKKREENAKALEGRDPADFAAASQGIGLVKDFNRQATAMDIAKIVRGMKSSEYDRTRGYIEKAVTWLIDFDTAIERVAKSCTN